jgi:RNA polymerase sigma-70 factor, ECF subfamily
MSPSSKEINNTPSKSESWKAWAVQAQSGDQKAYALLLRDILPYIKAVLSGGLANPDWVEDISQEVLISVHKSLQSYSPDRPFKPWLQAIIQFRRTDYLRQYYKSRKTKENVKANNEIYAQGVTNPMHSGELKDIEEAMAKLPANQKHIFEMMKIEGYSAKEIADKLGMTESAVKVSAHRAAGKIRGFMGDHG